MYVAIFCLKKQPKNLIMVHLYWLQVPFLLPLFTVLTIDFTSSLKSLLMKLSRNYEVSENVEENVTTKKPVCVKMEVEWCRRSLEPLYQFCWIKHYWKNIRMRNFVKCLPGEINGINKCNNIRSRHELFMRFSLILRI